MKITILGATGETGQHIVQQALDENHDVTAVISTSDKLTIDHEKLTVVEGDIYSHEEMCTHLRGVDVVMSSLEFTVDKKPVTGYTDITKCVVKAMREVDCKRLIVMHAWYTHPDSRNDGPFFVRWVVMPMIKPVLDNMREAEVYLASECVDINFTVVAPPRLMNTPKTDGNFVVLDQRFTVPGATATISRSDVARYMLTIAQDESSYKKIQAIAVKS